DTNLIGCSPLGVRRANKQLWVVSRRSNRCAYPAATCCGCRHPASYWTICVGLKRLRLAKEIDKRPQAIRTRHWVGQPPHRDVIDAFHLGVLLRKIRIANSGLTLNGEITELQKINCEMENLGVELAKFELAPGTD